MPYKKGESGNPAGRKPGTRTKKTLEAKDWAERLLKDPVYQKNLRKRLRAGEAPHMEALITQYRWGKPPQPMEHSGPGGGPISHKLGVLSEEEFRMLETLLAKVQR